VRPGSGHQAVLSNLVRCCSAFAHTSTAPSSLDSRCSALGPEPKASHNGQVIGSGQAAAPIHRMHHSNKHPVGSTKIRHAEEPAPAAGTALRAYYLLPPHACWRHKLLAPGLPPCSQCPSPPSPSERTRKIGPEQPEHATWPPLIFARKQTVSLRNATKGR
jgi:hypothetical protein